MAKTPLGLVGIAVLQLIGSVVSIVVGVLLFAVSMAPPMGGLTGMPLVGLIVAGSPAIMGFFGFLFAVLMLLGFRSAWYASLIYWTVLAMVSLVILSLMLLNVDWSTSSIWFMLIIPLAPLLFSVVSSVYFRKRRIKDYFGLP